MGNLAGDSSSRMGLDHTLTTLRRQKAWSAISFLMVPGLLYFSQPSECGVQGLPPVQFSIAHKHSGEKGNNRACSYTVRSSQTRKSPEVPAVHRGCWNWSRIYVRVMSGAMRVTCRKVLAGGRDFGSTYITPRFCWTVLHGMCSATGMRRALNCGARTECFKTH